jgi:hypothetical protein
MNVQDTARGKYLLALTVGFTEKANVNATVHKFSDEFDVVLFHYDGQTTEWDDEFQWSNKALHISARKQSKWSVSFFLGLASTVAQQVEKIIQ